MTGIILCGGKNSRINLKKAFLKIQGQTVIESILKKFKKLFEEIIIVTNTPLDYKHLNVKIIKDILPEKGSLGGIYSGLVEARNFYSFVAACDMPFIDIKLIEYMKKKTKNYDLVVPQFNNKFEPLLAFYSKKCVEPIRAQIENNNFKIIDFYSKVKVGIIKEDKIKKIDPKGLSFFNINTKLDYAKGLAMGAKETI